MLPAPHPDADLAPVRTLTRRPDAPARRNGGIPARDPGLPTALTREEAADLIMAAATERDRLLLETIYRTGARASEAAQLRRCDLGADHVRLPNRKQRVAQRRQKVVFVDPDLIARLLLWCQRRGIGDQDLIFPSRKGGGPLGKDQVRRIVMQAGERAGVRIERHGRLRAPWTHVLRHSAAVRWLEGSGGDIQFAAAQMGHASIRSMDAYRAIADERRRLLARQCVF